jgi:hypothetical protein
MATTEIEGIGVCILLSIHPTAYQEKAFHSIKVFTAISSHY